MVETDEVLKKMNTEEVESLLKGLTWKVYKYVLKNGPTGIREVQASLKLSTPTLALYHLNKLEQAGILKRVKEGYVVDQVFLQSRVKIRRLLIPRHFFYSLFLIAALVVQLSIFRPRILSREYVFSIGILCMITAICVYETARAIVKKIF